ncbi:porin family protein [Hymenobacter endophyticus]|uniref:Porin family protein n=1 Tax=Hymenobacter endophyticus TaxID=3076335 RepID=A0ABU3TF00_9BACT|nr:porin family protein [Hymenobacter endophyticus]MDU0369952.1 porin family protein [Hymenobacter endophyticus]
MRPFLFCSTALLVVSNLTVQAQTSEPVAAPTVVKSYWGFQGGYSNHHLSGSEVDLFFNQPFYSPDPKENRPAEAATVGLVMRQRLYKVLWLQEELNYVRKGGQMGGGALSDQSPVSIHYLQIPLLLHVQGPDAGPLAVFLQGGAVLNVALNKREINSAYYYPGNTYTDNTLIPGLAVGGGIAWQHSKHRMFSLTARYSPDLRDFFVRYFLKDYTLRHQGFTVTGGVLFGSKQ